MNLSQVRYGLYVPNLGDAAYASTLAELAHEAESAGWDGFFLWDTVMYTKGVPTVDSFVALSAITMNTRKIQIGTTVTPFCNIFGPSVMKGAMINNESDRCKDWLDFVSNANYSSEQITGVGTSAHHWGLRSVIT